MIFKRDFYQAYTVEELSVSEFERILARHALARHSKDDSEKTNTGQLLNRSHTYRSNLNFQANGRIFWSL